MDHDKLLQLAVILAMRQWGSAVGQLAGASRAVYTDRELWRGFHQHTGARGRTRLMHASLTGNALRVEFLLSVGAAVGACTHQGDTALLLASQGGHLEVVRLLVECGGASVSAGRALDGRTPLMEACLHGRLQVARELLARGASANAATGWGWTCLMMASMNGFTKVVRELLGRGAAVNAAQSSDGTTALMEACRNGHLEAARALIERGASVDAAMEYTGVTPLMLACQQGHLGVVSLLLTSGANRGAQHVNGRTALDMASTAPIYKLLKGRRV
jgi:ankyrin repeat protein